MQYIRSAVKPNELIFSKSIFNLKFLRKEFKYSQKPPIVRLRMIANSKDISFRD